MFNTIKRGIRPAAMMAVIALCLLVISCSEKTRTTGKKVLIIGFDGMDPGWLDSLE